MYNIKERQIKNAIKRHPDRVNVLELVEKTGVKLSKKEKENILIFGDIRGPYLFSDYEVLKEFSDYEVLNELLEDPEPEICLISK